jgi:hypothetical protein
MKQIAIKIVVHDNAPENVTDEAFKEARSMLKSSESDTKAILVKTVSRSNWRIHSVRINDENEVDEEGEFEIE